MKGTDDIHAGREGSVKEYTRRDSSPATYRKDES